MNIPRREIAMSDETEVRIGWYGGLTLTSEMIQCQRFQLEMEQHYRELQEEHDLLIYALKLKAASFRWHSPWTWF